MYLNQDAVTRSELTRTQEPSRNGCPLTFWISGEFSLVIVNLKPTDAAPVFLSLFVVVHFCTHEVGAARERTSAPSSL